MEKSVGIVRRLDELGRIVIPVELRKRLNINEKDEIEIYVEGNSIILKKYKDTYCPECLTRCEHTDKFCRECGTKF